MESELGSDYQVQESKIINHPEYSMPITVTRYGWAKRNRDTVWHTTKIEQALKDKNA
jgi:hypothetical protein